MKRSMLHTLAVRWALAALGAFACMPASAQIAIDEINPIRSSLHATNANGGSGGRIQSVAADPQDGNVYYAASEVDALACQAAICPMDMASPAKPTARRPR